MNGRMQRGRSLDVSSMRMIDQAAIEDHAFRNFNGLREKAAGGAAAEAVKTAPSVADAGSA
jgi:hypothetical protein